MSESNGSFESVPLEVGPLGEPIYLEPEGTPVPEVREEPVLDPPQEVFVTNEERLLAENLQLKIALIEMQRTDTLAKFDERLKEVYKEIARFQTLLTARYHIDFHTHAIESGTGRIIQMAKRAS